MNAAVAFRGGAGEADFEHARLSLPRWRRGSFSAVVRALLAPLYAPGALTDSGPRRPTRFLHQTRAWSGSIGRPNQ